MQKSGLYPIKNGPVDPTSTEPDKVEHFGPWYGGWRRPYWGNRWYNPIAYTNPVYVQTQPVQQNSDGNKWGNSGVPLIVSIIVIILLIFIAIKVATK